jgi:hypothetical protein
MIGKGKNMKTRSATKQDKVEEIGHAKESNKRLKTGEHDDDEQEVIETRIVPYKKIGSDTSSNNEEEKLPMDRISVNYDRNPLSSFDTFVCHLGDWKDPLTSYLKLPAFHKIFNNVKSDYESKI